MCRTHGLGVALLERLWVLDLAYRDCLYLFRGQDPKLDRARSLDRPRDTQKVGQPKVASASARGGTKDGVQGEGGGTHWVE